MRIITVRQPWAWAIIHGGKDVENRAYNIAGLYRGEVAIHAAQQVNTDAYSDPTLTAAWAEHGAGDIADLPTGVVLGTVMLTGVHDHADGCCGSPWGMAQHRHLTLSDPVPLTETVSAVGRLGLWTPDAALVDAIEALRPTVGDGPDGGDTDGAS